MSAARIKSIVSFNTQIEDDIENKTEERTSIDLSHTKLSALPSFEMKNIKQLYLENNSLTKLPENIFTEALNLQWLDLRNNQLNSLPESITNHPKLETMLLQNNLISHLPNYLGTLPNLKHLKLSGNPIVYPKHNIMKSSIETVLKYLNFYHEREKEERQIIDTKKEEWDICQDAEVGSIISNDNFKNDQNNTSDLSFKQIYPTNKEYTIEPPVYQNDTQKETIKIDFKGMKSYESNLEKTNERQLKLPMYSIKKHDREKKHQSIKNTYEKKPFQSDHSICNIEYVKRMKNDEPHKTNSTLFKYFNSNKYVKKSKVLDKEEQTLQIVQTAIEEKLLENKKEMLNKREKVLQDRKSLAALKNWRDSYKEGKDTNTHIYYTLNLSKLPYGTDLERVKILTRADIEQDLPDKYKKNIRYKGKMIVKKPREKTPIQMRILEVANCIDDIQKDDAGETPRARQNTAINEIKKLTDLRTKILKLKFDNEIGG